VPMPSKAMIELGVKAVRELSSLAPELSLAIKSNRLVESAVDVAKKARELLGEEANALPRMTDSAPTLSIKIKLCLSIS
jgi:hypothetical protein